ncbi:DEAD/DEAH box helicase [bacterium]|nr:DEAD/DEAH box helicase [bacterium]
MNLDQLIDYLRSTPSFSKNVAHWQIIEPSDGIYEEFPEGINKKIVSVLKERGITKLYSHQANSINAALNNENYVVVTPTASGKTLCYNLPIIQSIMDNPEHRALYLFPTKALSQDQVAELHEMVKALEIDIKTYTFDGDTPVSARKAIRMVGHIVVTNPDMLHQGVLPHHTKWVKLFENLKYIVIDEVHTYRGVFGSHLANLIRRLRRICKFYGSNPQFIGCSATIANPRELFEKLIEAPATLIDNNGAPRGRKHFIFYNPPVVNAELGIRKSSVKEAQYIASKLLQAGVQTIVFARSRMRVEILLTYLRETMKHLHKSPQLIRGYRGGYLPKQRRAIERGLRDGTIQGVVSTNALELGIDIGQLSAAVMAGYPGTIASTWQQAGRAGRRESLSIAILVSSSAPLDQYMMNNPQYFFERPAETGVIDPNNLIILLSHLKCAAFELPFRVDEQFGIDATDELLKYLEEHHVVHKAGDQYHWSDETYPAETISLRRAAPDNVVIIDTTNDDTVIGETDLFGAPMMVHDEAIYIHESQQYHVDKLDWDRRKAYVHQVSVDYYTDAESKTDIRVIEQFEEAPVPLGRRSFGEVSVTTLATLFKKIKFGTHENVGAGKIHLPEITMHTAAYWWEMDSDVKQILALTESTLSDGLKAVANVFSNVAPLWVMTDPMDLRVIPMLRSPFSSKPTIYIYEFTPGGVGYSRKLFGIHTQLLAAARDLIRSCQCKTGCPSCVGPILEVGKNGKKSALSLLALGLDEVQNTNGESISITDISLN